MRASVVLAACMALLACTDVRRNLAQDPSILAADGGRLDAAVRSTKALDAATPRATLDATPSVDPSARCGDHVCACDDGQDNDLDGLRDGLDPECTGAFDDDEASFATGLPIKQSNCRDCYWDNNNGSGDDDCRYPASCLTGAAPSGKGNCSSCTPSSTCIERCQTRTPNGCDCFGCCEVERAGGVHVSVELVDSCNLQRLDDVVACPRCVQNSACLNPCGRCELCLGKTAADLPRDCQDGAGPGYACEDGLTTCSAASPCGPGLYCLQGCCLVDLL